MPLRVYQEIRRLKPGVPICTCKAGGPVEEILTAPTGKMMETNDPLMGKSRMKDQMKILKERSRNYARDYEAKDLVDFNRANGIEKSGFLKKDGKLRGKIDDK